MTETTRRCSSLSPSPSKTNSSHESLLFPWISKQQPDPLEPSNPTTVAPPDYQHHRNHKPPQTTRRISDLNCKDLVASQKVFIDLVDNEAEHQDFGSRQDKVTPFEASMESMGRKIDRIRGFVVDLRNSSDVPPGFSESMSNSHSTPVHTVAPLTHSTSFIQNTQEGSSLYSLSLQRALDGLEGMGKGKERGDKPSGT
ncbi:hypothetical protein HAX54_053444 [Datura stramonium]|uniref:Uncharacterized protein n=1 Tax=Datura stramonium TaxID=4076 RepID=A0ABS8T0E8_DATST|nr:hypothetical protein [Datura stramonium]